jgi:hypothetical protein
MSDSYESCKSYNQENPIADKGNCLNQDLPDLTISGMGVQRIEKKSRNRKYLARMKDVNCLNQDLQDSRISRMGLDYSIICSSSRSYNGIELLRKSGSR